MDDDKTNSEGNQPVYPKQDAPRPIFETVYEDQEMKPEETPPEVDLPKQKNLTSSPISPHILDEQPVVYEGKKGTYFFIAAGVVFFFVVFLVMFRLFSGVQPSKKEVKLVYWGLWEEQEVIEPLIKEYEAKHKNITIEYQKMTPQEYREKLIARSKNGQGPDMFRFHNTWLPQIKDVVSPLPSTVMTNAEFEKTFYPIHQKDLKIDKYYYGIPLMIDGLVLIYNETLFKNAGIDKAPSHWDEVIDFATKLSVKSKDGTLITSGIALGLASNVEHFSDIFGLMLIQNGGSIRKLQEEEAVGALESFRRFAEPPNNIWDEYMPNSIAAFIQEKVAMIIAPSWEILPIKAANTRINLKVAPIPVVPGGKSVSLASYWVEGVSRFSKHQIEAWNFLRFLAEKDSMTKLYALQSKIRLFGEPYSRIDLSQMLIQNQYVGPVIKQADSFVSLPAVARTYDNGLNDEIKRYIENAINATTEGVSYREALQTAKMGIEQVFLRYKLE